jgi:N-acylneuraminate cytidylyltransferase
LINTTIVSSDSEAILEVAQQYGADVPFIRPAELATDLTPSTDVIVHAINWYLDEGVKYDYIVLLQPTSPFRKNGDIDKMITQAISSKADLVVSVKKSESNPYYVLFEEDKNGYLKPSKEGDFTRRQDCPDVFEYNGAIYVIKTESLLLSNSLKFEKIVKFEMDNYHSIDIDTQFDFDFAKFLLQKNYLKS